MTDTTLNNRIAKMIAKRDALRTLGEKFANEIFAEVFQGDALADQLEDLMTEFESPHAFMDERVWSEVNADYTDLIWFHIMATLTELVRSTQKPPTAN